MQLHVFYQLRYFMYKCPTITWWMFRFCLGKKEWNFPGNAFLALFWWVYADKLHLWLAVTLVNSGTLRCTSHQTEKKELYIFRSGTLDARCLNFFFPVESSLKVKRIQVVLFHASVSLRTSLIVQACFTPQVQVVWSGVKCSLSATCVPSCIHLSTSVRETFFFLSLSPYMNCWFLLCY